MVRVSINTYRMTKQKEYSGKGFLSPYERLFLELSNNRPCKTMEGLRGAYFALLGSCLDSFSNDSIINYTLEEKK